MRTPSLQQEVYESSTEFDKRIRTRKLRHSDKNEYKKITVLPSKSVYKNCYPSSIKTNSIEIIFIHRFRLSGESIVSNLLFALFLGRGGGTILDVINYIEKQIH